MPSNVMNTPRCGGPVDLLMMTPPWDDGPALGGSLWVFGQMDGHNPYAPIRLFADARRTKARSTDKFMLQSAQIRPARCQLHRHRLLHNLSNAPFRLDN